MKRFASQAFYRLPDEPPAAPVVTETPPADSNAIRQMREQLNTVLAEKKLADERATKAEALITESERAKLADNERLQLELADERKKVLELNPLTERTQQLEAKFTKLYEDKVAALPADKQEQARQLCEVVTSPEQRYDHLLSLETLLVPAVVPKVGGNGNAPSIPGTIPVTPNAPVNRPMSEWGDINIGQEILGVAGDPARAAALQHNLPKVKTE